MKVLVLNSGSSSIKFQLFDMPSENIICSGMVDRIGLKDSELKFEIDNNSNKIKADIPNHKTGLKMIADQLLKGEQSVIHKADEIDIVGHRVVHGGKDFSETVEINSQIKQKIKELSVLAPLHNPANLMGIEVAEEIFSKAKQIAVFDTAFHQSLPRKAYQYAIPNEFLEKDQIRVYGFHGTSHKYVSEKAIEFLGKSISKIITIHLGNGCSMTAIKDEKSVDHTLGFAPMNGLIMGTRSGDIDPAIVLYLIQNKGYTAEEVNTLLQKKSGMLGLTGFSDLRDIEALAEKGNEKCKLALEMNAYRIQKYIGAYAAVLNGVDTIVFTAGIGENSSTMRSLICKNLDYLHIKIDEEKNNQRSEGIMQIDDGEGVQILVIPTNEELEIAKQSFQLVNT